ncbi:MAG: hypothetical protein AAGB32_01995 [Pseudomonadota bacterium]
MTKWTISGIGKRVKGLASEALGTASGAAGRVTDSVADTASELASGASNTVNKVTGSVKNTIFDGFYTADELVQNARNSLADKIQHRGEQAGEIAGIGAECVTLVSTGGIAYLFFAGLPYELAKGTVTGISGFTSQIVRGGRPQFLGIHLHDPNLFDSFFGEEKDVFAMFYKPDHKDADKNGIAKLSEVELFWLNRENPSVYASAFYAVKEVKEQHGLPLKSTAVHRNLIADNMARKRL